MNKLITIVAATVICSAAMAQTLTGVKIEPAQPVVGEKATITATFDLKDGAINCGVRVRFGDGSPEIYFKVNQTKDVPMVLEHKFAKAGAQTVFVEPRTKLPMLKCSGSDQAAKITVVKAAVVVAAPAAPAAKASAGPQCPEGWKLDAKSVSKKSGAFTCTAKAGTALPAAKLDCPAPLGYFENKSRGQLGCRA